LENHMCKGNRGNRPERQLAALAKQALSQPEYFRLARPGPRAGLRATGQPAAAHL
jgi:hypothetical protein